MIVLAHGGCTFVADGAVTERGSFCGASNYADVLSHDFLRCGRGKSRLHAKLFQLLLFRLGFCLTRDVEFLKQQVIAGNISKRALQEWEQGGRQPDSAARAYLTVIAKKPAVVRRVLANE